MGLNREQKKLLKEAVRNQLHLDSVDVPPACAAVSRAVLERMLEFWRDNKSWFGDQSTFHPQELTENQRQSLGLAVRFRLRLDNLTLPPELCQVPRELLEPQVRKYAAWFNYRG